MRVVPPPLRVTLLPPSMTSFVPLSLNTFAVEVRTMVTGSGPQSKVMMPPSATAATNASPVQLSAVPFPMTVVGDETSSACPSAGTSACPSGHPAGGPSCGLVGSPLLLLDEVAPEDDVSPDEEVSSDDPEPSPSSPEPWPALAASSAPPIWHCRLRR